MTKPTQDLTELSVKDFCETTASDAPTPGGGSISALLGALAAALAEMVANLTASSDEKETAEISEIALQAKDLRERLLALIAEDAKSFDGVMAAFKLPKTTDEEKSFRKAKIQEGLKHASEVPFQVAKTASEIFPLAAFLIEKGNQNALTDAVISAINARSAVLGAALNVRINLGSIKDKDFVNTFQKELSQLESFAKEQETILLTKGYQKLSKD